MLSISGEVLYIENRGFKRKRDMHRKRKGGVALLPLDHLSGASGYAAFYMEPLRDRQEACSCRRTQSRLGAAYFHPLIGPGDLERRRWPGGGGGTELPRDTRVVVLVTLLAVLVLPTPPAP